jgi:DinB superfamily
MNRQETIAHALKTTQPLLLRALDGFDDATRTSQAPNLPNHAAWTLGHLALTIHRVAAHADGLPLPEQDFATAPADATGATSPTRYDTESICFNSTPSDDPTRYPSLARCIEIFIAAHDRLIDAARNATDDALDQTIPWGPTQIAVADLFIRMIYHNGTHGGQLLDLRRAMGFASLIK